MPLLPSIAKRLGGADRFNRGLAANVVARLDDKQVTSISTEATKVGVRAVVSYATGWLSRTPDGAARIRSIVPSLAVAVLKKRENTIDLKLDAVRLPGAGAYARVCAEALPLMPRMRKVSEAMFNNLVQGKAMRAAA